VASFEVGRLPGALLVLMPAVRRRVRIGHACNCRPTRRGRSGQGNEPGCRGRAGICRLVATCSGTGGMKRIGDFEIHGVADRSAARVDDLACDRTPGPSLAFAAGWSAPIQRHGKLDGARRRRAVVARDGARITGMCPTAEPGVSLPDF